MITARNVIFMKPLKYVKMLVIIIWSVTSHHTVLKWANYCIGGAFDGTCHFCCCTLFVENLVHPPSPLKERWNLIDLKYSKFLENLKNVKILIIVLWVFKISPYLRCERSVTLEIDPRCDLILIRLFKFGSKSGKIWSN